MSGVVHTEVVDGVALVTLVNVEQRNALTLAMVEELHAAWDDVAEDQTVGAAVVLGSGGTFCSGIERGVIETMDDPSSAPAIMRSTRVYSVFTRLAQLPVPTFAAVRGAAVGAGLNLAMAADVRVVARDAHLAAGFPRLGLHPGGGFFAMAAALAGRDAAVALGISGAVIDGERAVRLGLAWEAVDDADVENTAFALARPCGADPELARAASRSFRAEIGPPAVSWPAAAEIERAPQAWSFRRRAERGHDE